MKRAQNESAMHRQVHARHPRSLAKPPMATTESAPVDKYSASNSSRDQQATSSLHVLSEIVHEENQVYL